MLHLSLRKKYFDAVKAGTKKVEGRLNRPKFEELKAGMPISFSCTDTDEILICTIEALNTYKNFSDMLRNEGLENMLPGVKYLEEGIALYESFPGYKETVKEIGAIAIKINIYGDELLDLVNENDEIIKQEYRSIIYNNKLSHFRVINAFIINDDKKLWIPIRSKNKKLFPLCLDASVGGHVAAGESYDAAFKRETMEEIGIHIDQVPYTFLTKLTPYTHNVSAFMHVYALYTNETPSYNHNDFDGYVWVSIQDLKRMIQDGKKTKGDLPTLVDILEKFI